MSTEFGQWRYEGSWQTPIPNALISDKRLSPSALKLWIVLRAAILPGQTLSPTYDYLVDQCNLSRSTVSRCVKVLRALRWIQTKQVMTSTGWLSGSMYRMFDTPLGITEIAPLDSDYPGFLAQCAAAEDSGLRDLALIEIHAWHSAGFATITVSSSKTRLRSSKIELLRMRDVVSSCSTTTNERIGIETCAREDWVWPEVIPQDVRQKASPRLATLPEGMAQEILDEVQFRYHAGKASNPVSLLFGLIPIAEDGRFLITGGLNVAKARARQKPSLLIQAHLPDQSHEDEKRAAQAAHEKDIKRLWAAVSTAATSGQT